MTTEYEHHKYKKLTKLKLTSIVAEEWNEEEGKTTWKEGDIVTVEPTTKTLCEKYDEEDYYEDGYDTYCIHEHTTTKCGWSLTFIEDTNKFIPVKKKVTNWKKEFM